MKEGPAYTVINSRPAGSERGTGCKGEIPWIPAITDPAGAGGADHSRDMMKPESGMHLPTRIIYYRTSNTVLRNFRKFP